MQPSRLKSTACVQTPEIEFLPGAYIQPNTAPKFTIFNTSIGHGKHLSNLIKIYINNTKYNRYNDNFNLKLAIIHDIYLKADVLFKAKIKAFFTIIKGLAINYYYFNISIIAIPLNFDQICNFIQNYIRGAQYKQIIFLK